MKRLLDRMVGMLASSGCLSIVVIVLVLNLLCGGLLAEYTGEYWLSFFKKAPVDVPFGWAMVVGLVFAEFLARRRALCTWVADGVNIVADYRQGEKETEPQVLK